jgi:transposase
MKDLGHFPPSFMSRRLSAQERGRIHTLASIGWTDEQISADLKVAKGTVQRWKHRSFVGDAPRSGRPTKLTPSVLKTIDKQATRKRRVFQRQIAQRVGLGHGTVQKAITQLDLSYRLRSMRPPLSDEDRRRRVKYAKAEKERDWGHVVFLDEAIIRGGTSPHQINRGVYVHAGDRIDAIPVVAHGQSFNACGAIFEGGRTPLELFTGSMTADAFVDILRDTILPAVRKHFGDAPWTLVMDGNRAHTARATVDFLESEGVDFISRDRWPPRSPDLNAIENIWAMLKRRLGEPGRRGSKVFEKRILACWDAIPQEHIDNTINSIPKRLEHVIKEKGETYPC